LEAGPEKNFPHVWPTDARLEEGVGAAVAWWKLPARSASVRERRENIVLTERL